jgi:glutaredoxin
VSVELITRKGCHLCDEALELLRSLGVEPELRDVDSDPGLFAEYDFRVPVVRVAGRVVGEGAVRREPLVRALARQPPR